MAVGTKRSKDVQRMESQRSKRKITTKAVPPAKTVTKKIQQRLQRTILK